MIIKKELSYKDIKTEIIIIITLLDGYEEVHIEYGKRYGDRKVIRINIESDSLLKEVEKILMDLVKEFKDSADSKEKKERAQLVCDYVTDYYRPDSTILGVHVRSI